MKLMKCLTLVSTVELDALLVVNPESELEVVSSDFSTSSLTMDSSLASDRDIDHNL